MVTFRLRYVAKEVRLDDGRSIQLGTDVDGTLTIELRRITDDELRSGAERGNLLCTAKLQATPTRKIRKWLDSPTESPPVGFTEFSDGAFHTLSEAIIRSLRLLRWRVGHRSARNPVTVLHSFEWSSDDDTWIPVPDAIHAEMDVGIPQDIITDEVVSSFQDLWRNNAAEPLAHELFQEAWSQRNENPKSSLVIGIAAAETGIKQLISKQVPASAWLVQNTQSPPLAKMLEEYLPTLPTRTMLNNASPPPLPKSLIGIIVKAVALRNEIVHGKDVRLERKSLREILNAIHDLVYIFDLYAGELWAMRRISVETKEAWLQVRPN